MKIQNKLLFAISLISIGIVIFQLWSTIPDINEYADGRKWILTWDPDTETYDWLLTYDPQADALMVETSVELILNVCFFSLVAFWSFSGAIENKNQTPSNPEIQ